MIAISTPYLFSQIGFNLSSSPVVVGERLELDGILIQIQNNVNFNGEVAIEIYSDRFQTNLIAKSIDLRISGKLHSFNLAEVFTSSKIKWEKVESNNICFQIKSRKQNIALGLACFDIERTNLLQNQLSKNNPKIEKAKEILGLNVSYDFERIPQNSTLSYNHYLDYSGEVSVSDMPFKFQGFYQTNKDPYFNHNLNNASIFFDVDQWKEIIRKKLESKIEQERDSVLSDFDKYDEYLRKNEYAKKVLESKSVLEDKESIEQLKGSIKNEAIASLRELSEIEHYRDSIQNQIGECKEDLINYESLGLDSTNVHEIQERLSKLKSTYDEVDSLYGAISKEKGYEQIDEIKDKSDQYLGKARAIKSDYEDKVDALFSNPKSINSLLKSSNIDDKHFKFMNYVSDLRFGNVNPAYSDLLLQNSQIQGGIFGLDFGKVGLSAFYGKSTNRSLAFETDTIQNSENKVSGISFTFDKANKVKSNVFAMASQSSDSEFNPSNQIIFGHGMNVNISDANLLDFDIAISFEDGASIDNNNALLRKSAGLLNYEFNSTKSKMTFNANVEYYGPEFKDINNPFLINNSIEFSSNINYQIFEGVNLGVNSIFLEGGVLETDSNQTRSNFTKGFNLSIVKEKLPSIQYVFNNSEVRFNDYDVLSIYHSVNLAKGYKLFGSSGQTLFNVSHLSNSSSVDSIAIDVLSGFISQEVQIGTKFKLLSSVNYMNSKSLESSNQELRYSLTIPINLKKINISPGYVFIDNNEFKKSGYSLTVSWRMLNSLSLNFTANTLWLNSRINEFGVFENEYSPYFNTRVNYRF